MQIGEINERSGEVTARCGKREGYRKVPLRGGDIQPRVLGNAAHLSAACPGEHQALVTPGVEAPAFQRQINGSWVIIIQTAGINDLTQRAQARLVFTEILILVMKRSAASGVRL
jgi:hypothetical protein